ncbi:hypothetical protein BAUCODRAFT_154961 [Baudoinia panamericana UAMH 10762]|uniref:Uncharacterized protein n=1 Tax=Baudoinia panamericana (strain UAMH 10762) TaxID=717646 RepID=M2N5K9_BAUPA|nr:uncharacterized protein BAUCODRAFT_154961 [Baudoinia panamericana UAMH 10762]EMC99318.1 hypothetical protein BAUCODRAFT_154961 [Baudoinia panamericana UAMH 10762]
MTRQRAGPSSNPHVPPSRKRQQSEDARQDAASAKRRTSNGLLASADTASLGERQVSPARNVHFGRRLERGPSISTADHRNQSPKRSALRHETDHHSVTDMPDTDLDDEDRRTILEMIDDSGPSNQLLDGLLEYVQDANEVNGIQASELVDAFSETRPNGSPLRTSTESPRRSPISDQDPRVCEQLNKLQRLIYDLAADLPILLPEARDFAFNELLAAKSHQQLVRYIGYLALGGPNGRTSWEALIASDECRRSLVWAITSHSLKEHVFDALWFGASEAEEKELQDQERRLLDLDGLHRTAERAKLCAKFAARHGLQTDRRLTSMKCRLVIQLENLLAPLWLVFVPFPQRLQNSLLGDVRRKLVAIVSHAVDLSHVMRCTEDIVYFWPPTFKDETFEPARMECLNLANMYRHSPFVKQDSGERQRPKLRPGSEDQSDAIVRIMCFPGLIAYRKGGGELAQEQLRWERRQTNNAPPDVRLVQQTRDGNYSGYEGFRTRVLCKAIVHLQWGKQRLLTREAGTSLYLNAVRDHSSKYEQDYIGFVELYDIFQRKHTNQARSKKGVRSQQRTWSGSLFGGGEGSAKGKAGGPAPSRGKAGR